MPGASVNFRRRSDRLWLYGLFLAPLLLLVNSLRVPISERLVPDARLNRNLERAQKALAHGELSRPDGRGARELFESVLAIDPDQQQAREGVLEVRGAALARADTELRERRIDDARRDIALAQALDAPVVALQPLRERLRTLEEASIDVPALLARASAPEASDEQALALLDQVLAIDAGNAVALEGRREIFSEWLLQAERDLDAGEVEKAREKISRVIAADPGHVDLPPLRARLADIDDARAKTPSSQVASAQAVQSKIPTAAQREAARLASQCYASATAGGHPQHAQACVEAWLAAEPDSDEAIAARAQLAERWLAIAEERIGASDWKAAREALASARKLAPDNPRLPQLEARLRRAEK
jgi:tetratricopeptide (TPR) repeat protein